ncbi:acyltransferase [Novosphingobium sp. PASSN1]|uniref:acyltransferase family protein n=1 Tax=Novosphingobium sp. PASSN1 TaxID=2015561 RepID=UPI000BD9EECE|nr:acyltransferase [Novosphingobium sp. PASSN1]OYU35260.1 MAG: acyltransferase [Novosphingobium sp. PASSN1]
MQVKQHYAVLDGLRGVAAILVVVFHLSEVLAGGDPAGNVLPHGALAVDFFFGLSGFVIGYAYDERWPEMSTGQFLLRRLIRLHPLVLLATAFGATAYVLSPYPGPDHGVSALRMALTVAAALLVLPYPALPERFDDTHSLDGPTWTLLQEYIGSLAYALVLRRLDLRALFGLALACAAITLVSAAHFGTMSKGFGFDGWWMAPVRLAFPFVCGLWLHRAVGYLPACRLGLAPLSLALLAIFAAPAIGGAGTTSNGIAEALAVIVVFPAVILLGAHSGASEAAIRACSLLGRLSYPLYILHYPFVYCFIDYARFGHGAPATSLAATPVLFMSVMLLAWLGLRLWDEPVRGWLSRRLLGSKVAPGS